MGIALVTGSNGLIGSEAARFFADLGADVVGIDNNLRRTFFGKDGCTLSKRELLLSELHGRYTHYDIDIRDLDAMRACFQRYAGGIDVIIHTAAQPSHDWAARDPIMDFSVNAQGTLNLLELARQYAPNTPFIFTSTNKVYGDRPNSLPLVELESRWEIAPSHEYAAGVPESMSIDNSLHSVFGASKVAADVMVQEYGRYFGMPTVCFRGGCLTGPNHSGAELHGFLAYLMKCCVVERPYTVYGYKGKQVRDNIHSADLVAAFYEFYKAPRSAEVYNIGGGRESNCSMLEAVALCEEISGKRLQISYKEDNRIGDHIWWVSDLAKFKEHYPQWKLSHNVPSILEDIFVRNIDQWVNDIARVETTNQPSVIS